MVDQMWRPLRYHRVKNVSLRVEKLSKVLVQVHCHHQMPPPNLWQALETTLKFDDDALLPSRL